MSEAAEALYLAMTQFPQITITPDEYSASDFYCTGSLDRDCHGGCPYIDYCSQTSDAFIEVCEHYPELRI